MKSIGTRFSVVVVACAFAFALLILWLAWTCSNRQAEELISAQTELALEFDLAIQDYVREVVRPAMEEQLGPDEFCVEAMSSSYVARNVVDRVRERFPDYLLKFPSDNPRNPENRATPEEVKLIEHFRDNPDEERWAGKFTIDGREYWAHASAMRIDATCLRCHGVPEDAPAALTERYPTSGGLHWKVGDVSGMAMIAVPLDTVNASLQSDVRMNLLVMLGWLVVLFGLILIAFRRIVARRLEAITSHFRAAAAEESPPVEFGPVSGNDEISILARSFNSLAGRLRALHGSLEQQVRQRTQELSDTNESLRREVEQRTAAEKALRREERLLKRSLKRNDAERQVLAYEIHDGLTQCLTGAIMAFQAAEGLKGDNPKEADRQHEAGVKMLHQCLSEARRMIDGVRPPLLDEQGVVVAVQNLLSECQKGEGPEIELHHSARFERMEPVVENAVYRIVQESVNNAIQHSGSPRIQVSLRQENTHVWLEVRDWGVGFDVTQKRPAAMGLRGIRERAKSLGGQVTFHSQPGAGTTVVVELPLEFREEASDDSDV